jgi:hypothetical protein
VENTNNGGNLTIGGGWGESKIQAHGFTQIKRIDLNESSVTRVQRFLDLSLKKKEIN